MNDFITGIEKRAKEENEKGKEMARGKEKMESQKRNAERNQKPKGSQLEARAAALKTICSVCKAQLANHNQLVDHYTSKHPKMQPPPAPSSSS